MIMKYLAQMRDSVPFARSQTNLFLLSGRWMRPANRHVESYITTDSRGKKNPHKVHIIFRYVLYNEMRTHRSLNKDAPLPHPVQRTGRIVCHALAGELHDQYVRI
jgi:hypothetical protein